MSINVNTKNYDTAREYLAAAASPLDDISIDIGEAIKNLDSRIIPYVIGDYNYVNNQIKNVYASNEILSTEIENFKQKCKTIEDKATGAISRKNESLLTSMSMETSESLSSQLLYVEEQAVIQNHIDNQEIAYLTASLVSDPTSTLSYTTPYVDEITAAADADVAATGAENGGKSESFWGKVGNFFKGIGSYIVDSIVHPFKTLVKTGASIVNFAVGLINGVLNFVEALVDCVALIVTAVASIFTGLYDLCQWIGGKITGNEDWESATKKMWGGVMKFVATKWVDKAFNGFYENTAVGKWLDDQAYGPFKHTGGMYKFSKGVGYVVGIVILTIVTYGIGGVASGAGGAAGSAGSAAAGAASGAASSATSSFASAATAVFTTKGGAALLGAVGAAAGTGKNTQNAWADGASLGEGLTYGVAMGAYEGLQFYTGARINMLQVGGSKLLTAGSHVALDTVDGASSGFVDPLLKMIYTPNEQNQEQILYYVNYDENGNKIDNKTWDELTFGQKYKAMFEYNGGWKTVGTNAAIAGVLSTITEVPDIAAAVKTPKVDLGNAGAEATEQALKTADVDSSVIKNVTDGADSSVVKNVADGADSTVVKETAASWGTKLKEKYHSVADWISDKTGAAWAKGKSVWDRIFKKGDASKNLTDAVDTSAAKQVTDAVDTTTAKQVTDAAGATKTTAETLSGASKTVDAVDEVVVKTGAEKVAEARSALDEAIASKKPIAIAKARVQYARASFSAFKEKIAKYIDELPFVKKAKSVKKSVTDKVDSVKASAKEAIDNNTVVKGYRKGKQKVIDTLDNNPIVKGLKKGKESFSSDMTKTGAFIEIGPVKGTKLKTSMSKLSELYKMDTKAMTADQLADWTKQVTAQKEAIAKLKIKPDTLRNIVSLEEQLDVDMVILTDKMQSVLKTDKKFLTNDEVLARTDKASVQEFIDYVEANPKMTKTQYKKVYKRFMAGLGLTTAGYFVFNGTFED